MVKTRLWLHFWATCGKIWASYHSIVWSHWHLYEIIKWLILPNQLEHVLVCLMMVFATTIQLFCTLLTTKLYFFLGLDSNPIPTRLVVGCSTIEP